MAKETFTDNKRVRDLIKLMADHGLTEIELVEDKAKIRLKRDLFPAPGAMPVMHYPVAPHAGPVVQALPAASTAGPAAGGTTPAADNLIPIKSPMVGTFYGAANPESDQFVKIGSRVEKETVVCIIEAMKVFNEIHAEVSGTIAKILVQNGQVVEFNQPMFLVTPD